MTLVIVALLMSAVGAQDRLRTLPGYEQYQKVSREIPGSVISGAIAPVWIDGGSSFEYVLDGQRYRYEIASGRTTPLGPAEPLRPSAVGGVGLGAGAARGLRPDAVVSPDGAFQAYPQNHNLWLSDLGGGGATAVTTDGGETARIRYGSVPWIYVEELRQTTGIWWSASGTKVAAYRFDQRAVADYSLLLGQTQPRSTVGVEAYPFPGTANPLVDVLVHDVTARETVKLDVRDGKPFDDTTLGHYVYRIEWTPDGREVTLTRMNRRQNVLELTACNPDSGRCRAVVREESPASWVDSHPAMRYLADGRRFLWVSERTGFKNLYLYDLSGTLLSTLTRHSFEVSDIVHVDEAAGVVYYTARDGDNHMKVQLHRVRLDGTEDRRLTDPALHHRVSVAPDGRHFIDVAETHDRPPASRLMATDGRAIANLAASNVTKFEQLGLKRVELFTFTSGDNVTTLHGMLHFPSTFDSSRRYPLLVTAYAGPGTNGASEEFTLPNRLTEYGFLVASMDSRSAAGRGKRALDAIYGNVGVVEVDDQAAGVRALWTRPYVDRRRIGVFGTSYGGSVSLMALLRHPDVFAAAASSSPVTDWRQYNSIYTERYLGLPSDNAARYEQASALRLAATLTGRLMLFYGTADHNVHPSNSLQLIQALQREGKSFDLQVGPDQGHSSLNEDRMMEFFIEHLVQKAGATAPAF